MEKQLMKLITDGKTIVEKQLTEKKLSKNIWQNAMSKK